MSGQTSSIADRANLAETQSEITGRLASTLQVQMVEAAARRIAEQQAADPDAQDLVMRGWAVWYRGFSADREKEARHLFERALELDPQSTDARVGVANLLLSWTRCLAKDKAVIEQDEKRAEQLLLEALERDPNNSSAHGALGVLRRLQNRLDESRIELQTAIADDPNNCDGAGPARPHADVAGPTGGGHPPYRAGDTASILAQI